MVKAFDSWEKDKDCGAGKHSGFCVCLWFIGRRIDLF
jgi:hypothetical protein